MPKRTPRLIYVEHTTWCTFKWAMNGRWCSKLVLTILNMSWCHLALLTHMFFLTFDERCLCEYLDDFVVCYIHDIFIFLQNMEDHECHVPLVLEKFQEVGLYAKLKKCEFLQFKVEFLNNVISRNGIPMDLRKI
jgi:hypothetical protein